ncbi:MAG: hypothetical protein FWG03_06955 [Clostridiales bacterium]|nr:hypothetical protein [Clostridiales bacterium]
MEINSKRRMWTGPIPNNGSANLFNGKKLGFIIHPVNDYPRVQAFFESALKRPVKAIIDKGRKQTDDIEKEFNSQKPDIKRQIKKAATILNTAGLIAGLWLMIFPIPFLPVFLACLTLPVLSLIFYTYNRKPISLGEKKPDSLPDIFCGILLPALALSITALRDINVLYSGRAWVGILVLTFIITAAVMYKTRNRKKEKSTAAVLAIFIFIYSYGAVVTTNCVFDYHEPAWFPVKVDEKIYNKGRYVGDYQLVVTVGDERDSVTAYVPEEIYLETKPGGNAWLAIFPGFWGIEWCLIFPPD